MEIRDKEIQLQKEIKERERELGVRIFIEKEKLQHFDVTKHIRFVPPFHENEVDSIFFILKK